MNRESVISVGSLIRESLCDPGGDISVRDNSQTKKRKNRNEIGYIDS
jgi:hypothetical protein